jgi:hypothetical protein
MHEITNRTLVFLIAIAIFFMLFGTVTVLNKLGVDTFSPLTGAAPFQNAQVNVRVAATTSIVLNHAGNVSFGNGSAFGGVVLSTASGFDNPNTFSDPTTAGASDFTIENDGNVDVNVTVNGSAAANFITTGTSPLYNFSGQNHSVAGDNGCFNVSAAAATYTNGKVNSSQIRFGVGAANHSICSNLTFVDVNDTVNVTINLFLPTDTEPGNYTDTRIFFMAVKV